jgi:prepilin-type N-terminal cleavage/methylation domain-containing protein
MQGSHITRSDTASPGSHICHPEVSRRVLVAPNCRVASSCDAPSRLGPHSRRRRAFTLTELLVVIAIIGVLASLITAAAVNALRTAKRARIVLEIKQMATAIENFKNDFGAYPPNAMSINGIVPGPKPIDVASDLQRMAKKAFPRINPQELEVFKALAGGSYSATIVTDSKVTNGMSAAEALYFWFGGFSADPQFPLSGPGGPSFTVATGEVLEDRIRRYEFDLGLLAPRDEDGVFDDVDNGGSGRFVEYSIDMNGNNVRTDAGEVRRINLWRFAPSGFESTFVYFDCSRYKPTQYDMRAFDTTAFPGAPDVYPIMQFRSGASTSTSAADLRFVNDKKFQILHPGLDDAWGPELAKSGNYPNVDPSDDPSAYLLFPAGPFTGEAADTLTNFTDGAIADEAEE